MAQALTQYEVLKRIAPRAAVPRMRDDFLDSIRTSVAWTLITVVGFWTPLAIIAYAVAW